MRPAGYEAPNCAPARHCVCSVRRGRPEYRCVATRQNVSALRLRTRLADGGILGTTRASSAAAEQAESASSVQAPQNAVDVRGLSPAPDGTASIGSHHGVLMCDLALAWTLTTCGRMYLRSRKAAYEWKPRNRPIEIDAGRFPRGWVRTFSIRMGRVAVRNRVISVVRGTFAVLDPRGASVPPFYRIAGKDPAHLPASLRRWCCLCARMGLATVSRPQASLNHARPPGSSSAPIRPVASSKSTRFRAAVLTVTVVRRSRGTSPRTGDSSKVVAGSLCQRSESVVPPRPAQRRGARVHA
jgi:hypothetical protein